MRKVLNLAIKGLLIGTFVGLWLSILFSGLATNATHYGSLVTSDFAWKDMLISSILWALLGVWMSIASVIFERVKSRLNATMLHAVVIYFPCIAVAYHEKWMTTETWLPFTVIFVLTYLGIWVGSYTYMKKQIRAMNVKLMSVRKKF